MKKKRVGYGDFYCWNCGERIIKNKRKCPYCGVWYEGKNKYANPELIKTVYSDIHDKTFRRYRRKQLLGYLIFILIFSALLPLIIWIGDMGETSFSYIFEEVYLGVIAILWTFWAIWIIVQSAGRKKKMKAVQEQNRSSPVEIKCAACGYSCRRSENYCTRCGCVLLK